jgi:hypothetical protein
LLMMILGVCGEIDTHVHHQDPVAGGQFSVSKRQTDGVRCKLSRGQSTNTPTKAEGAHRLRARGTALLY